eukprot:scaffold3892_cov255-Pinguiococcus_pyrenoidosus.AAC.7
MDYAFQTPGYAILALTLETGGDLQEAIDNSPLQRLNESRVVLYTAEIILALQHLHELGLVYRDLKPCNVLLSSNGHIKLADMGGVADLKGDVLDHSNEKADKDGLYRRRSVMGTRGYMAPEVLDVSLGPCVMGYTQAVDFWSLGASVYKLLVGRRPFDQHEYDDVMRRGTEFDDDREELYLKLLEKVPFPTSISDAGCDLIVGLLAFKPEKRLGCNEEGVDALCRHEFFNGLDFIALARGNIDVPWKPAEKPPSEKPVYKSFDKMLEALDRTTQMTKHAYDWSSVRCSATALSSSRATPLTGRHTLHTGANDATAELLSQLGLRFAAHAKGRDGHRAGNGSSGVQLEGTPRS